MKQIYQANCIEDGERFISLFQTDEKNPEKLREIGEEMASEWGAECISVKKWKPRKLARVSYSGWKEPSVMSEKQFENLRKKYPEIKFGVESFEEETPKSVFDIEEEEEKDRRRATMSPEEAIADARKELQKLGVM